MLEQFDRLREHNAFLEQYKEKMFEHGLEEFDDTSFSLEYFFRTLHSQRCISIIRTTCEELKEYKACESLDYITCQ
jgi:hypothetical protein